MPTDINSQLGVKLVLASIAVAFALLLFFLIVRAWRRRGTRGFAGAARNRGPRLAVVDSTAVDQRRRLVLIRRDDVEHLILTGGPSDLVVESRIGGNVSVPETVDRASVSPVAKDVQAHAPEEAPEPAAAAVPTAQGAASTTSQAADAKRHEPDTPPSAPIAEEPLPVTTPPARSTAPRVDVDEMFDSNRERVFGPSGPERAASEPTAPVYARAYAEEQDGLAHPNATGQAGKDSLRPSVVRFEDFLDTEVESDLSRVRPGERAVPPPRAEAPQPASTPSSRPATERPADDRALSEEMSRLLSELSQKR